VQESGKEPPPGIDQAPLEPAPADDAGGPEPRQEPVTPEPTPREVAPELQPEPPVDRRSVPDVPSTQDDLTRAGPIATKELPTQSVQLPASTGCKVQFCTVKLSISMPSDAAGVGARKAPYPLAIFSNGFIVSASFYASYAKRLASWGYVVIRWDTNNENPLRSIPHKTLGEMIKGLIDWADAQAKDASSPLGGMVSTAAVLAAGHSRGGKASALAAQIDARIKGLFLLDPVDAAPGQTSDLAVPGMAKTQAPLAVVGADKGGDGFQACAPKDHNYAKFYDAATTKAWEILLKDAGHMQFLDTQSGCLACIACAKGQTPDATVRQITQSAMMAWAEFTIRGRDPAAFVTGTWLQGWLAKQALTSRNK